MKPTNNPFINEYMQSKTYGMSPHQIIDQKFSMPAQAPTRASSGVGSLLGGTLGAIGGGLLGGGTTFGLGAAPGAIAGGAAGSALGDTLEQLLMHKDHHVDLGNVGVEGALGLAGGVGGKLLGAGVKGVRAARGVKTAATLGDALTDVSSKGLVQRTAGKAGDALAIKALRLTPSQQSKYATQTGEEVSKTLSRHNLQGMGADAIGAKAEELQSAFDAIAKNTAVKVPSTAIQSHLKEILAPLKNSTISEHKALAQKIEQEMADVLKKAGTGKATLADLNKMRQEYDAATKSFANDPIMSGKVRAIGTVLRRSVQSVADSAGLKSTTGAGLKETGRELKKLYDLAEIAGKQDYLGRGSSPLNLLTLAGGAAGGVPGMAATYALNSKPVIRGAAKALTSMGQNGVPGAGIAKGLGNLAKAGAAQGAARVAYNSATNQQQPADSALPQDLMAGLSPDQTAFTQPQDAPQSNSSLTPEMLQSAYQQILSEPDGTRRKSMIAELKSLVDLQDSISPVAKAPKPLSAEGSKQVANATSGLKAIAQLQQAVTSNPGIANKNAAASVLGGNVGRGVAGTQEFEAAKQEIIDVISRSRSGAALTPAEISHYQQALPRYGDSPEVTRQKLARFQDLFSQILQLQQQGSPDIESLR